MVLTQSLTTEAGQDDTLVAQGFVVGPRPNNASLPNITSTVWIEMDCVVHAAENGTANGNRCVVVASCNHSIIADRVLLALDGVVVPTKNDGVVSILNPHILLHKPLREHTHVGSTHQHDCRQQAPHDTNNTAMIAMATNQHVVFSATSHAGGIHGLEHLVVEATPDRGVVSTSSYHNNNDANNKNNNKEWRW